MCSASVDDRRDRKPRGREEDWVLPGALGTRGSGQICLLQGEEAIAKQYACLIDVLL